MIVYSHSILLGLFLSLFSIASIAQDLNNYEPLKSQGKVPEVFRTTSTEKYEKEMEKISEAGNGNQEELDKFYLKNSFAIDNLLLSGKVMFNDEVGKYINEVANKLLESKPELRDKLKIYAVKSSRVNAITTNDGSIFVTLGLIAQLENEAQLAYILAHEVIHFEEEHILDSYLENKKIEEGVKPWDYNSLRDAILAKSNYSKEKEFESDEKGTDIYLKSDYSVEEILPVFDVLQYAYLPFDEVKFERSFFETETLVFPEDYYLEEVAPITADGVYDDTESTHPNIQSRRENISEILETNDKGGSKKYIISKERFMKIRDIARFEITHINQKNRNYGRAIYNAYVLLKKYPDNVFLKSVVGTSLYALAKYKDDGRLYEVLYDYEDVEGESQQLIYFLDYLTSEEMAMLAVHYMWRVHKANQDDKNMDDFLKEAFYHYVSEFEVRPADFYKVAKEELIAQKEAERKKIEDSLETGEELSKYDKIKLSKQEDDVERDEGFYKFAFVDHFQDENFDSLFHQTVKKYKEDEENNDAEDLNYLSSTNPFANDFFIDNRDENIDKVVLVNPRFFRYDKKEGGLSYLQSEKNKRALTSWYKSGADFQNIELSIIDTKGFEEEDVKKFNDYAILNDWVSERFDHGSLKVTPNYQASIDDIIERYGTRYYMWTGVISSKSRRKGGASVLCCSAMSLVFLPVGIWYAFTPQEKAFYYTLVFDIKTGKPVVTAGQVVTGKKYENKLQDKIKTTLYKIKTKD